MTPSPSGLQLALQARETSGVLYPEQAADFDMTLTNHTSSPATVLLLSGNLETPVIVAQAAGGREIGRYTEYDLRKRSGSDPEHKEPGKPAVITLNPGLADRSPLSLWRFTGAFGPGRYSVRVEHELAEDGAVVQSNPVSFDIVAADVAGMCLGSAAIDQSSSVMAWLARPHSDPHSKQRLLVRLSSRRDHAILEMGANNFGEFAADAHVAVGQAAESTPINGQGWVLVAAGSEATLIRHNMANPMGRVGPVPLPASGALAIPGFPDFGVRALALATGNGTKGPVLIGFAAQEGRAAPAWTVPLSAKPVLAAAAARTQKSAQIVYAADDGRQCRVYRIGVDPAGKVTDPEKVLHTSPHMPRAVRIIAGREQPPVFLFLESERQNPARVTYLRIPLDGAPRAFEPHTIGGWPLIRGNENHPVPALPAAFDISQDAAGTILVAATDSEGNLYGGRLDRGLSLLRKANGDPASFPHISCLRRSSTVGAFRADGRLFFARNAGRAQ